MKTQTLKKNDISEYDRNEKNKDQKDQDEQEKAADKKRKKHKTVKSVYSQKDKLNFYVKVLGYNYILYEWTVAYLRRRRAAFDIVWNDKSNDEVRSVMVFVCQTNIKDEMIIHSKCNKYNQTWNKNLPV